MMRGVLGSRPTGDVCITGKALTLWVTTPAPSRLLSKDDKTNYGNHLIKTFRGSGRQVFGMAVKLLYPI